ncbi:MAG: F0F1 ATP synthase subunit gamma [Bacilli bacterium]|nr:F0F1 ATP synthase subunit gamma [Bacilli bacterium]
MANLSYVDKRRKNVIKNKKILRAMYLISSIQIQKTKGKYEGTKIFFKKIEESIIDIISANNNIDYKYFKESKNDKKIYIVLTSDNGLVGEYNQNILKFLQKEDIAKSNSILLIAGYIGKKLIKKNKYNIDDKFDFFINSPSLLRASDMTEYIIDLYNKDSYDEVYVIYSSMVNTFIQKVKKIRLFPLDIGKFEEDTNEKLLVNMEYEPNIEEVLDSMFELYLKGIMYDILIDAYMSEQASRLIAMNKATVNADKLISNLNLEYNKKRQEKITREIAEISNH